MEEYDIRYWIADEKHNTTIKSCLMANFQIAAEFGRLEMIDPSLSERCESSGHDSV